MGQDLGSAFDHPNPPLEVQAAYPRREGLAPPGRRLDERAFGVRPEGRQDEPGDTSARAEVGKPGRRGFELRHGSLGKASSVVQMGGDVPRSEVSLRLGALEDLEKLRFPVHRRRLRRG